MPVSDTAWLKAEIRREKALVKWRPPRGSPDRQCTARTRKGRRCKAPCAIRDDGTLCTTCKSHDGTPRPPAVRVVTLRNLEGALERRMAGVRRALAEATKLALEQAARGDVAEMATRPVRRSERKGAQCKTCEAPRDWRERLVPRMRPLPAWDELAEQQERQARQARRAAMPLEGGIEAGSVGETGTYTDMGGGRWWWGSVGGVGGGDVGNGGGGTYIGPPSPRWPTPENPTTPLPNSPTISLDMPLNVTTSTCMKAIIYTRVSTDEQAESGLGLEAQLEACRRECFRRGLEIAAVYSDPGVSGGADPFSRRGLAGALKALEGSHDTLLMVSALSRLTRRQSVLWALLDGRQLRLASASEPFDTSTPLGRAMVGMLGVWAQLEADMIADRTRSALAARKARGLKLGRAFVEVDAAVISQIVSRSEVGMGYAKIAAELNSMGVPSLGGGKWHVSSVRRVLKRHVQPAPATGDSSDGSDASGPLAIDEGGRPGESDQKGGR